MITKIFEKVNEYVVIRSDIEWYEKTVFAHSGRWGRRFESSLPDQLFEKEFQDGILKFLFLIEVKRL